MEIHAFSGFSTKSMVQTRTAGILAALLETYPEMTWDDVLQWTYENGIDNWVPTLDTADTQKDRLIGGDYLVSFDDRYPWNAEAQKNFELWRKDYEIGKLPPIETASPAIQEVFTDPVISSQPAPLPQSQPIDDWDFFQSQNTDTTLPQSSPSPAPVATPSPTYTQSSTPAPATTPAINPVSYQKPEPKKEGSSNMLLIVGGIIAVYMLMKRKK